MFTSYLYYLDNGPLNGLQNFKMTVPWDFRPLFFCSKESTLDPIWTGKNDFANFFVFEKIFDRKISKILWPRSRLTTRTCTFFIRKGGFHIFKLLLVSLLTHQNNFFHLIVPLKSVRWLQSFPKCSHSQQLF